MSVESLLAAQLLLPRLCGPLLLSDSPSPWLIDSGTQGGGGTTG